MCLTKIVGITDDKSVFVIIFIATDAGDPLKKKENEAHERVGYVRLVYK